MAKKSLGYVELEWTCPSCGTKNPGAKKTCISCGMPQPDDVVFEQPAEEKLIEDEAKVAEAKAGPDIHCHYCGTRNSATASNCSQCGADLGEGAKRESGQVLGAHRDRPAEPIECPACGASNDAAAPKCVSCGASLVVSKPKPKATPPPVPQKSNRLLIFGLIAAVLLICGCIIGFIVLSTRTEDVSGTVKGTTWTRTIAIEELAPVTRETWRNEIPAGAVVGICREKVHHTESQPTGQTREICGTPYTVETGSGYGEVVQDCRTEQITEEVEIYAEACEFTVEEWQQVDQVRLDGNDLAPSWPNPALARNQRQGDREESYECVFSTESGQYNYTTGNQTEFLKCEIGSRWILKINTFNAVTDIEPLR